MRKISTIQAYLWLAPLLAVVIFLVAFPLSLTFKSSFYTVNLLNMDAGRFVGFDNYKQLFGDPVVQRSFFNSLFYLVIALVAETILGFFLALALKRPFKGRGGLLAILIIPWALPPLLNGILWRLICDAQYGLLNDILLKLHLIHGIKIWMNDPHWSKWVILVAHVWKMLPLAVVLFLAQLQTLPKEIEEAAMIDGAGFWSNLRYIILPCMLPMMMIVWAQATLAGFHLFDEAYILTGTAMDTRSLLIQNYLIAFREKDIGLGMALSLLISLASIGWMMIYGKLGRGRLR